MTISNELQEAVSADVPFFKVVEERRSIRRYDSSAVITEDEIRELLTIATKAPSSSNLQPWRFLVITDRETKERLLPIANNQQQVVEASAIILVMADLEMYKHAEQVYESAAKAGYMSEEVKNTMIANSARYASIPAERLKEIAVFDSGLVSMQLMLAAKAKGYDTVPMGGYNRDKAIEFFNIPERYLPVLMLPIGKAASPGHPTTRLPIDQIVFFNEL